MCGRFASTLPPEQLARIFGVTGPLPNIPPSWNVAPTQPAVAVRLHPETRARTLGVLSWGLLPHFMKEGGKTPRPINARGETVASNGMFKGAFAARRCLVPADAYYEWHAAAGAKVPYAIGRSDGGPLALGGIWEGHKAADGTVTRSFAIVTVAASAALAHLHPRMPLVVEAADWGTWLGEGGDAAGLLRSSADGVLRAWRVSTRVNNVRNNDAALLEVVTN